VITGFCDVQGDRLEIQFVAWGPDEESWAVSYHIIHQDPAQPQAWRELDVLIASKFTTVTGRPLRVAAFGIDVGGNFGDQVLSFCKQRRGRRIFACKGAAGARPIWPGRASRSKSGAPFFLTGVDTAKEAIYGRLKIDPPEPGFPKPGFIHFPVAENFGPAYYEQLDSERRQIRKRMGQSYAVWVQIRERNEVLDCWVGCLAMRKALPRYIEQGLEYSVVRNPAGQTELDPGQAPPQPRQIEPQQGTDVVHEAYATSRNQPAWIGPRRGWMDRGE
jgi:phage terminase large subunit GpA-like protein